MPDGKHGTNTKIENAQQRRERLAAELRSNLAKRKTQARARAKSDDAADDPAVLLGSAPANKAGSSR